MRVFDRALVLGCSVMFLISMPMRGGAEAPQPNLSVERQAEGTVIGVVGMPARGIAAGSAAGEMFKVGDVVLSGEELRVGMGEQLVLLWDHRAVLTLQDGARVNIHETHRGQTELLLHQGTLRIALSYDAGRMTDTVTLRTPLSRVVSRGGIMEATVSAGDGQSFFARLITAPAGETLRVLEGQARVEPMTGDRKAISLKTGTMVALKTGRVGAISEIQRDVDTPQGLAVRDEHRVLPDAVTRQIVGTQVGHALEFEKNLQRPSSDGAEREPYGSATKGTILATSIGLPLIPTNPTSGQASALGASTSGSTIISPPTGGALQAAGVGGTGPAQSGGLNSSKLLQQILNDVGKVKKGKNR